VIEQSRRPRHPTAPVIRHAPVIEGGFACRLTAPPSISARGSLNINDVHPVQPIVDSMSFAAGN